MSYSLSKEEAAEAISKKKKKKPEEGAEQEAMESIKRQFQSGSFMDKIKNRFGKNKNG